MHVLKAQELGQSEKEYYLATSENGRVKLATDPLPSQQIAEEQLNKFYQREPEETQAESVQLRSQEDGKEE